LYDSLVRKQRKHEAMVRKVEKANDRLERRKARLVAMETRIADLENELSAPRKSKLGKRASSDGELKPARLIFNPSSGRDAEDNAARLAKLVNNLRAHGIEAKVGLKTSGAAARDLARKAIKSGDPLVIVAGGDGTIGDVAAELIGKDIVLGIVPTGTMNNVARSLGVPLDIEGACALIGMGTTRHIDMGRITTSAGTDAEYFLECAGVGLSAIVAAGGQALVKRRWNLVPRALRKFFEAKPGKIIVELDDTVVEATTRIITVSNAPLMGNKMLAVPGGKMDDGLLDVQVYDGMDMAALAKHFKAASSDSPEDLKTYRASKVRIKSAEPIPANADMNIAPAENVIEMEVIPKALSVIVGNGIALTTPVESAPDAPPFAEDPPITVEEPKPPKEPVLSDA
ncbi:MAG TPA: diacylglycerol kinase family protein, partial [Candidatus Krumholzibacteria bacterium]|nr:diacylglycerol kinase family protein [Candidatus Krumholzibacteria bacterium]